MNGYCFIISRVMSLCLPGLHSCIYQAFVYRNMRKSISLDITISSKPSVIHEVCRLSVSRISNDTHVLHFCALLRHQPIVAWTLPPITWSALLPMTLLIKAKAHRRRPIQPQKFEVKYSESLRSQDQEYSVLGENSTHQGYSSPIQFYG